MARQPSEVKDRRLKIYFSSNGHWVNSGYAVFTRDFLTRLVKDGWDVAEGAFVGLEGAPTTIDGIKVYPKLQDAFGSDALLAHSRHFKAGVSFSMQDIWTLNPQHLQQMPTWIPYLPIDQEPISPAILNNLRYANRIITFSKYGQKILEKAGFTSTLIVEGTDPDIFKPQDKLEMRKKFNIPPNAFVFGQIGANKENPPRKGWQQSLEAFKLFHDKHPESIYFYQTNQFQPGNFPMGDYAKYLGILPWVMTMEPYMGTVHTGSKEVSELLNAFDVLLHPSMTEGFGLLSIEAQSCGVPVIVNNCHSQPELVIPGVTGEICDYAYKHFSSAGGFWYVPDTNSIYEKMEKLFKADRVEMGKKARQNILDNYDINKLFTEKWVPYLTDLQEELLGKPVAV